MKCRQSLGVTLTGAVAHEASGCRKLSIAVHCWEVVASRQGDDLLDLAVEKRIGEHKHCSGALFDRFCICGIDVALATRLKRANLQPQARTDCLNLPDFGFVVWIVGIKNYRN